MKASPIFKKDDWSPLLWAACNGNESIVRALLKNNAHSEYVHNKEDEAPEEDEKQETKKEDAFGKIPDAKKIGKYTPLHWASYKGHLKVVWLLLKAGLSPIDDQDIYGNTAVHQAAASGNIDVLKCFLSRGVDIDKVNARGDSPLALATQQETKELILKTVKTKKCQHPGCDCVFDFKNFRYYCQQSDKFYCSKHSTTDWVHEAWNSDEAERPICRSTEIQKKIKANESELKEAMETNEFAPLDKCLATCADIDLDVILRHKAELMNIRLMHELKIRTFLKDKFHHENYKEIRKDIATLEKMLANAHALDIELDDKLVGEVNGFISRLE